MKRYHIVLYCVIDCTKHCNKTMEIHYKAKEHKAMYINAKQYHLVNSNSGCINKHICFVWF